ncbi:MAG TPA: tetratricopeptide repeat protein [Longimicrobium sp.]|jgi:tetratricopeptide (TPR) repeat protein
MKNDQQHQALVDATQELIERARQVVPRFACFALRDEDIRALLDHVRLFVAEWDMEVGSLLIPAPKHWRALFLQSSLNLTCKRFVTLEEVGRFLAGDVEHAKLLAECFAFAGTIVPPALCPDVERVVALGVADLRVGLGESWYRNRLTKRLEPIVQSVTRGVRTANAAYQRGRAARAGSRYAEAKREFRRAINVGEAAGEWGIVAASHIGLGNVARQQGNLPKARQHYADAVQVTTTAEAGGLAGSAHHEWFLLELEIQNFSEARKQASLALRGYDRGHPTLPHLAADVGQLFLLEGRYRLALEVQHAVEPYMTEPRNQMIWHAQTCRAAAGSGDAVLYHQAWDATWAIAALAVTREDVAESLLHLAHAAHFMGDFSRAVLAATKALQLAIERKEGRIAIEADQLLGALKCGGTSCDVPPLRWEGEGVVSGLLKAEIVEALVPCLAL